LAPLAVALRGTASTVKRRRKQARGTVEWGYTAREWLIQNRILPDCEFRPEPQPESGSSLRIQTFGYNHHRQGDLDYYFIRSGSREGQSVEDVAKGERKSTRLNSSHMIIEYDVI